MVDMGGLMCREGVFFFNIESLLFTFSPPRRLQK